MVGADGTDPDPCENHDASFYAHSLPEGAPPVIKRYKYPNGIYAFFSSYREKVDEGHRLTDFEEMGGGERHFTDIFLEGDLTAVPSVGMYEGGLDWGGVNGAKTPCYISVFVLDHSITEAELRELLGPDADKLDRHLERGDFKPKFLPPETIPEALPEPALEPATVSSA